MHKDLNSIHALVRDLTLSSTKIKEGTGDIIKMLEERNKFIERATVALDEKQKNIVGGLKALSDDLSSAIESIRNDFTVMHADNLEMIKAIKGEPDAEPKNN